MVRGRPGKSAPAAAKAKGEKVDWFLEERGLYAADTTGDGNCMFRGLSVALFGTEDRHMELRQTTCDHEEALVDELMWFAPEEEEVGRRGGRRRARSPSPTSMRENFLARVARMRRSRTWGNELELRAFADSHDVRVTTWVRPAPGRAGRQHNRADLRKPTKYGPKGAARRAYLVFDQGESHYEVLRNAAGPHEGRPHTRPLHLHLERGEEGTRGRDDDASSVTSCGSKRSLSDRQDADDDCKDEPAKKKSRSSSPAPTSGPAVDNAATSAPRSAGAGDSADNNTTDNTEAAIKGSSTVDAAVTSSAPSAPAAIDENTGSTSPVEVGRPRRSSTSSETSKSSKRSFSQREQDGDEEAQETESRPVKSPRLGATPDNTATAAVKTSGPPSSTVKAAATTTGLAEDSEGESDPDFDAFERDVRHRDAVARALRKEKAAAKKAARHQRVAGVARKPASPGPSSKEEEAPAKVTRTASVEEPEAAVHPETEPSAATRSVVKGSDNLGTQKKTSGARKPSSATVKGRVTKSRRSPSGKKKADYRRLEEEEEGVSAGDGKEKGTGRGKALPPPMEKKRRTPRSRR